MQSIEQLKNAVARFRATYQTITSSSLTSEAQAKQRVSKLEALAQEISDTTTDIEAFKGEMERAVEAAEQLEEDLSSLDDEANDARLEAEYFDPDEEASDQRPLAVKTSAHDLYR